MSATTNPALRNAYRWFWALTLASIGLVGALSTEVAAHPSPLIGLAVATTSTALVLLVTQAARVMRAIDRAAPPRRRVP